MNIICVAGGSFYSFYINYFLKIKHCDILVFNFEIFDTLDLKEEMSGSGIIEDIEQLSQRLNCPVVVGVMVKSNGRLYPAILSYYKEMMGISGVRRGLELKIKNKTFIIGVKNTNFRNCNKIILSKDRMYPKLDNFSKKINIFCDRLGVYIAYKKKLTRKFNKCSKIILK
ncbi:MAG: hypothetical protein ACLRFL_00440 [Clostridia bacterium]